LLISKNDPVNKSKVKQDENEIMKRQLVFLTICFVCFGQIKEKIIIHVLHEGKKFVYSKINGIIKNFFNLKKRINKPK